MPDAFDDVTPDSTDPYASTIQTIEGWYPGSKSYRNNNPGNLKFDKQPEATGADPQGFAVFPDYAHGLTALHKQIALDAGRGLTIQQFVNKYAPRKDNNDPTTYAARLASATGKSVDDPLGPDAFDTLNPNQKNNSVPKDLSGWDWLKAKAAEGGKNIANGVLGGLGLPDMDDPSWKNPIRASDIPAALNPWNLIKGIGATGLDQQSKMKDAASRGDALGVINHAIGAAVPPLAPAANAPEVGGVRGLAQSATNIGSLLLGGREGVDATIPEETAETPKLGSPPLAPKALTPEEANHAAATSKIIQASQPPNKLVPKVQEAMKTYLPNIKKQEPFVGPIDSDTQAIADQKLKGDLKTQFDSYANPAIARGQKFDGNTLADARLNSIDQVDRTDHPANFQNEIDLTNKWRKQMDFPEIYDRFQKSYTNVKNYWNATPGEKAAMQIAGAKPAQDLATYNAAREAILKGLDSDNDGNVLAQIQKQRADQLTASPLFDDIRATRAKQINPSSTQKAFDIISGLTAGGAGMGAMAEGHPMLGLPAAGYGMYRVAKTLKPPTDLNTMVADAFKNYKGTGPEDLTNPNAGPITDPTRLLERGPIRMGSSQTSAEPPKMNVTTGEPLNTYNPSPFGVDEKGNLQLTPPPGPSPIPHNWDKMLIPEWEFPNVPGNEPTPINVNNLPSGATRP